MLKGQIRVELELGRERLINVRKMITESNEPDKMDSLVQHEDLVKQVIEVGVSLLKLIEDYKRG